MLKTIKKIIPQSIKNRLRQGSFIWRLSKKISPFLPRVICVDVGASYYPHGKWLVFLNSPNTNWIAVEPNESNLKYTKSWCWKSQLKCKTIGLSRDGGPCTLFVTNVESGSSLLPPVIEPSMAHRIGCQSYFFPVHERGIVTMRLSDVVKDEPDNAPIFVKLDTQGTELSILEGSLDLLKNQRIIGIELESSLLAKPVMKGAGKFWEVCSFLENNGFELIKLKPINAIGLTESRKKISYINECDAIFGLRADLLGEHPVVYRAGLFAFYTTNELYGEALALLERDQEVGSLLQSQGCDVKSLKQFLEKGCDS
jgi:FkbM family methyltransferase